MLQEKRKKSIPNMCIGSCKRVLDKPNCSNVTFAEPTWTIFWFSFYIAHLNTCSDFFSFISEGIISHTFGPRKNIVSSPL